MITIVHGGQSGVDRGAHDAAIELGWTIAGCMSHDGRDEFGKIPEDVAKFLRPHERPGYAARTDINVRSSDAILIVARDARDPRATPGTALTIDLAAKQRRCLKIADPRSGREIAAWIWRDVLGQGELPLIEARSVRLMVAGPRESRWPGARAETTDLFRRVAQELCEMSARRAAS
jgi:hypothetical protein